MNTKGIYSKILELEKDLLFNKKIRNVSKRHFDFGYNISLKYDDGLNEYAQQSSLDNADPVTVPEFSNPDSLQFSNNDYYIDSFSNENAEPEESDSAKPNYATQKDYDDPNNGLTDNYIVTNSSSGTNPDGSTYSNKSTEVYEDEIAYNSRRGGEYAAESSFDDDIKAILSGQKVYNEEQKQLVTSSALNLTSDDDSKYSNESSNPGDNHNNGLRNQEIKNPHAIFESLAQSFGNASSYDLGTFNLDKSFAEIEGAIARKEQTEAETRRSDYIANADPVVVIENKTSDLPPFTGNVDPVKNEGSLLPLAGTTRTVQQLSLNALDISEDFAIINELTAANNRSNLPPGLPLQDDQKPACETNQYNQSLSITNVSAALAVTPELVPLLSYLQIGYDVFQPVENRYFSRLKELLVFHRVMTPTEVLDSSNYINKVKDFQRTVMNQGSPDGIPGEDTLFELQKGWADTRGLTLVRSGIRNDAYGGSQIPFIMRSDALAKYNQLYDQVHNQNGVITSAGSFRELSASVSAGRSSTSMHYTGLAFDLHTGSALQNTTGNPYLVERSGANRWHVWNKVQPPNGSVQSMNAQLYNTNTRTISPVAVSERVIDFKNIANINGFKDIGNRSCFPDDYMCAEWWHFQCEDVLVPYLSQFGTELLTIYSENQLSIHPNIWQNKKKIFKRDWF